MNSLYPQLRNRSQTMQYGKTTIEYDLVKSKRVKTSEIIVDENKILVRTPFDKSQFEIDKLLEGKAKWIQTPPSLQIAFRYIRIKSQKIRYNHDLTAGREYLFRKAKSIHSDIESDSRPYQSTARTQDC
jgi:predicted metal-dependent hydrolase